jgi:DNA-directed RNA polymerase specialized sigma subunit
MLGNLINSHRLSELEKNELVQKHEGIVQAIAYKYRYFDRDFDDIKGWGFVGLAKAILAYEKDRECDLVSLIFVKVKQEIYSQYKKAKISPFLQTSLQAELLKDSTGYALDDLLSDENALVFSEKDMKSMVATALFEETEISRKVTMDYLFTQKELKDIAKENRLSEVLVKRTVRRGQALIKNYLVDNDIILDYLMHPNEERKKQKNIINHKKIFPQDYGKVKYIGINFPYLTANDLAILLDTSSYAVTELWNYPTTAYIRALPDDSIRNQVLKYCKRKYPERLPGPLMVSQKSNKIMA